MHAVTASTVGHPVQPLFYPDFCRFDQLCLDALRHEVLAWPKPGLVTPVDSGSHRDMHVGTFLSSITALAGTFASFARAGAKAADFQALQSIGLAAEKRMCSSTGGINTHRGAIFNLGLLAAAAARRDADPASAGLNCGAVVRRVWGEQILDSRRNSPPSHGNRVFQQYAAGGARAEGGSGFPTVYRSGVPPLRRLLGAGYSSERALIGTLLALIEDVADTNLLWRGGEAGLAYAQGAARAFNADGGVEHPSWRERLVAMHGEFVTRNLSPGGSADLVAAAWVAYHLDLPGSHL
jgi:triphosphoribosyl-dephospho-CoA synthase